MKKLITLLLLAIATTSFAQDKVWVFFKDKDVSSFNPYEYFDQKAIDRRLLNGLPLVEFTDVAVTSNYIKSVKDITGNVKVVTRWFNGVCCFATEDQKKKILDLPYVESVKTVSTIEKHCAGLSSTYEDGDFEPTDDQIKFLKAQTQRMGVESFKKNSITGKGVRVAIFDVGFKSYTTNPAFNHIRENNRIIATYNFVQKKEDVDNGGTHGTFVMSCVGGIINGHNIGLATDAEFLLARTETWTEFYSEEENWLAAAEWADKNGADVINSSLGYTYHRYFREDMDGATSLVAKAANMAARKGILVVNSAGNEGSAKWKNIGTPADADSVLSIGGIHPRTGIHTSFSSFGPTWDKRLKPNVTAYGHVIGSGPKGISETQGTSFSGPLVAGFAACAKQARPGYTNMQLFDDIHKSADLYPYFDYAHGYGVPQASYYFKMPQKSEKTFEIKIKNTTVNILLDTSKMKDENLGSKNTLKFEDRYIKWPNYVFYHIENSKGYLDKYFVVDPTDLFGNIKVDDNQLKEGAQSTSPLNISKADYARPFTLRVFYKGHVEEILVK